MEYHAIQDGWIKVPAADFMIGQKAEPIGRLLIGVNQLFIRIAGKCVLIDTGLGEKWSREELSILDFETPRGLIPGLAEIGCSPDEIDIVILSHLHYDHCGGSTRRQDDGSIVAAFPNAVYYVQNTEKEFAESPIPEHETDYMPEDWKVLESEGRLEVLDGDAEVLPGLKLYLANGHCPGHQVVLAEEGNSAIFFPGDLFSTPEHANLKVATSFDYDRDLLLKHRKHWLNECRKHNWQVFYCHSIREIIQTIK